MGQNRKSTSRSAQIVNCSLTIEQGRKVILNKWSQDKHKKKKNNLDKREHYQNNKGHFENFIANILLLKALFLSLEQDMGVHFHHWYSTLYWKFYPEQLDKKEKLKESKVEEIKLCLFRDDMILHIQNPKEYTRKVLELINSAKFQSTRSTYKN